MCECAICTQEIYLDEKSIIYNGDKFYNGDKCHLRCALEDQDAIGMDAEFGDN